VAVMSDPWKVSDDVFPRSGEAEEKLRFLLNYAVLAPLRDTTPSPGCLGLGMARCISTPTGPAGCRS
jgi:hypothetical protein